MASMCKCKLGDIIELCSHKLVKIYYFRMCPIFQVSNVSGENLDLVKMFMNLLQSSICVDASVPAEFQIDSTFSVPVSYWDELS